MHIHICIHICIYTHMYTHMYIYIYTCIIYNAYVCAAPGRRVPADIYNNDNINTYNIGINVYIYIYIYYIHTTNNNNNIYNIVKNATGPAKAARVYLKLDARTCASDDAKLYMHLKLYMYMYMRTSYSYLKLDACLFETCVRF